MDQLKSVFLPYVNSKRSSANLICSYQGQFIKWTLSKCASLKMFSLVIIIIGGNVLLGSCEGHKRNGRIFWMGFV